MTFYLLLLTVGIAKGQLTGVGWRQLDINNNQYPLLDTTLFTSEAIFIDSCGILSGIDCLSNVLRNPTPPFNPEYRSQIGLTDQWALFDVNNWFSQYPIYSFAFKDQATGWGALHHWSNGYVGKTIDSGKTWIRSSTEGVYRTVGYASGTDRVFASDVDSTFTSTDEGATWNVLFPEPHFSFEFSTPFVGVAGGASGSPLIYTSDGGLTWQHSALVGDEFQPCAIVGTQTFFAASESGPNANAVYRSDDGGANWKFVYQFPPVDTLTGSIAGDLCHLFVQTSQEVFESTDEGVSWTSIGWPGNLKETGIWSNGSVLIATEPLQLVYPWDNTIFEYLITPYVVAPIPNFDCSTSKQTIEFHILDDCHNSVLQGIALTGSSAFSIAQKPNTPDTLLVDDSIIIQYRATSASPDTAYLVMSVCTKAGTIDTSIAIYGSGLPQSKPVLSVGSVKAVSCSELDTSVSFFMTGDCNESILENALITGSSAFQLTRTPTLPDTLFADESVGVRFISTEGKRDTAHLLLTIQTPTGVIDTSILLLGSSSKQSLNLLSSLSASSANAGGQVTLTIRPDQAIQNKSLNTLDFDLSFNDDLLDVVNMTTAIPGATLASSVGSVTNHVRTIPIHISGNNMTLDPSQSVLSVSFKAVLTDSSSTPITLGNLQLNGGDPNYRCTLAADISSTTFNLALLCGDSTIQQFMRQGNIAFVIQSITPNPTSGKLTVTLAKRTSLPIEYELSDALGHTALKGEMSNGKNTIEMQSLASGSYYLRLVSEETVQSRRIVLTR